MWATAENKTAIPRAGGIEALIAALTRHVTVENVAEAASAALRNITSNNGTHLALR